MVGRKLVVQSFPVVRVTVLDDRVVGRFDRALGHDSAVLVDLFGVEFRHRFLVMKGAGVLRQSCPQFRSLLLLLAL
jgi:hypothetical protein